MSETRQFKAEVQKLLDLVINSLYSNKEIFLRELLSNASDAIDRARFESVKDSSLLEGVGDWKIKLTVDEDAKTLTISDNGIGMSAEEVESNIGTIASSGTKAFLEHLSENKESLPPELIGQFGVGFYSSFMVADEVTVLTRRIGTKSGGVKWQSRGDGYYTLVPFDKPGTGTDVILHLKEDAEQYLEEWQLRKLVKKYSDFVEHPICMDIRREEYERDEEGKRIEGKEPKVTITEEVLNSQKAIWQRKKDEVKEEEYAEFYRHVSHDFQDPFETIHWSVEGQVEFKALLYIPKKPLYDMFMPEQRDKGVQLYVHRVFITDKCEELVPPYLHFLRGVVDSSDLPLNVSREMLQEAKALRIIQKNLVKKVLDTLSDMQSKAPERYQEFWTNFGATLKTGIHLDPTNSERIQKLMLFESTMTEEGKRTTLEDYVKRMPESQKEIYFITAENRAAAANAPQLEAFKSKGYEVLYMTDPVDEWIVQDIGKFEDKPLQSIIKGDIDLDTEEEKAEKGEKWKALEADNKDLLEKVREVLGDKVKEVRLSKRLTESACCLVNDEFGMTANMEKLMKAMNQDLPAAKRIFELNGEHPLIVSMRGMVGDKSKADTLADYIELLYGQACLTAQIPLDDPLSFSKKLSALMVDRKD
jgi:molecular chaperone HtpG